MERTIVKEISFASAHFLPGMGKCERLHGHNYKATIVITTEEPDYDVVMDFSAISDIGKNMDHKLLVGKVDDLHITYDNAMVRIGWGCGGITYEREIYTLMDDVYFMETLPTAENIAKHIAELIAQRLWCAADIEVSVEEDVGSVATHRMSNYTEGDELEG